MADATGSSAGAAGTDPGAAAGHGDLGRGIPQGQYQTLLTPSMNRIAPNIYPQTHHQQHQYPVGLIPAAPVGMPVPAPRPVYSTQIVVPPPQQQLAPLPQYRAQFQSQQPPLAGHYQHQDYSAAYGNATSPTSPSLGFAGWRMYSNALMSFAEQTPPFSSSGNINNSNISVNNNGFHQNSSPYPTTIWTNYVPTNRPYCASYGRAATNDPAAIQAPPSFHNNNQQERDLGFATSFVAPAPVIPASPFEVTSQRPTNYSSAQVFQEVKNLDGTLRASGSIEIEGSEASEETDPVPELEAQNQLGQGVRNVNSADSTRDAEANLPFLADKDGMILEMDDLELHDVWKFKYRYWPNNKSRMYILETTGEFVKKHSLEAGDVFIIYQHKSTGRHVARAVKAGQMSFTMSALECQCMKEDNSGEECGFIVNPPTKKT
ncbi:hypothetical protein QOZ80_4AG0299470 [Eleusine coracana subsp. coracana]|nr:hypothetical protein QOZ80_4AG0299470 [Eleusine coracana subsp. coracana]